MDYVANFDLEKNEIEANFDLEQPIQFDAVLEINPSGIPEINGSELIDVEKHGSTFTIKSKNYIHEQGIASNVWVINHNLNKKPSVTVVDSGYSAQLPDDIIYNNDNQITLKFISAFSGTAYLN